MCRVLSRQKRYPGIRSKPRRCCPARQVKKAELFVKTKLHLGTQALAVDDGQGPPPHSPMNWARLQQLWQREEARHRGLPPVQNLTAFHFVDLWSA